MCLAAAAKYFAPSELQTYRNSWFYKHLVPPGPKTVLGGAVAI